MFRAGLSGVGSNPGKIFARVVNFWFGCLANISNIYRVRGIVKQNDASSRLPKPISRTMKINVNTPVENELIILFLKGRMLTRKNQVNEKGGGTFGWAGQIEWARG